MKTLVILPLAVLMLLFIVASKPMCSCGADDPVLDSRTVSVHTVQYGTMPMHTKGRGAMARIGPRAEARIMVLLSFARNVKIGDPAGIRIVGIGGTLAGKVTNIGDLKAGQEQVPVELSFDQPLPPGVMPGDSADALIEYGRIENTLYMERGFFDTANSDVQVFRVEPDEKHATQVTVHFGVIASEMIEIKSGLHAGDKVIVTDMSRWTNSNRLRIE